LGHASHFGFVLMALTAASLGGARVFGADATHASEKEKAQANPYANDFGPDALPTDVLATYPKEHQDAYRDVLQTKCVKCHNAARALNSQFFEPQGKGKEKQAKLDALSRTDPDIFENKALWQPEVDIWQRYVKRMMAKPGCDISVEEGKAVYKFLVYDSNQRKIGARKAAWKTQRQKLLDEFKAKHPARYDELYGGKN